MMRLRVEFTTNHPTGKVGTDALSKLCYSLHRWLAAPDLIVLQGPPHGRTVLWRESIVDSENSAALTAELVTTPEDPEEEYWRT